MKYRIPIADPAPTPAPIAPPCHHLIPRSTVSITGAAEVASRWKRGDWAGPIGRDWAASGPAVAPRISVVRRRLRGDIGDREFRVGRLEGEATPPPGDGTARRCAADRGNSRRRAR